MFMSMLKFCNQNFGGQMESEFLLFMTLLLKFNFQTIQQLIQEKFLMESEVLSSIKKISNSQL